MKSIINPPGSIVIGAGRVAIYDNVRRNGSWYYWLKPGDRFDLSTWSKLTP